MAQIIVNTVAQWDTFDAEVVHSGSGSPAMKRL
jgi:hypothetical protein